MQRKLLYFSWVRERIGREEENLALPDEVETPGELLLWLKSRGEEYEAAFEFPDMIRVALDQQHVEHNSPIGDAHEIAIFPPMTGG